MRRRVLSTEELDKIIKLRQAGASWLRIQHETGIHRRTAKRAYDKWNSGKTTEELKEARKEVALQEFRRHMDDLITLATSFVINLEVPHLPELMDKDAEQFVSSLFEGDLLRRGAYISSTDTREAYESCVPRSLVDPRADRRANELLFESLQVHTREKVRWEVWDEWKEARYKCKRVLNMLSKEIRKEVSNFLHQEGGLLRIIKEGSREDDPVKRMGEAVLREIWAIIFQDKLDEIQDKPDEEGPLFETVLRRMGPPGDTDVIVKSKNSDQDALKFIGETNIGLAEKVTRICESVGNNLRKGDMVAQQLQQEVHRMKKASDELREGLNPVKLRPMILGTRCELCPA